MMKINICNLIRVLEKDEVIFRFYFGSLIFFLISSKVFLNAVVYFRNFECLKNKN